MVVYLAVWSILPDDPYIVYSKKKRVVFYHSASDRDSFFFLSVRENGGTLYINLCTLDYMLIKKCRRRLQEVVTGTKRRRTGCCVTDLAILRLGVCQFFFF